MCKNTICLFESLTDDIEVVGEVDKKNKLVNISIALPYGDSSSYIFNLSSKIKIFIRDGRPVLELDINSNKEELF